MARRGRVLAISAAFVATTLVMVSNFPLLGPRMDWWVATLHLLAYPAFIGGTLAAGWGLRASWKIDS